jgi:hypothetical protein
MFSASAIDQAYNYVYGHHGFIGVMFCLMGLAVAVVSIFIILDRRR